MVHRIVDQNKRLARRAIPRLRSVSVSVRRRGTPRVPFAVEEGEAGVGDVVAAVLVDAFHVGWGGDVETVAADQRAVFEVDGAAYEGALVGGDPGAGLQVAPFGAVLVGPAAPGLLVEGVLLVEGCVAVGEAFVLGLGGGGAAFDNGGVDVADVV